jgi:AcrR family transcriptional regulator
VSRAYRLGKRQESVDRTAQSILNAARALVSDGPASALSVGAVARRAGVSRITIYNRFGSRSGLLEALAPDHRDVEPGEGDARAALRRYLVQRCAAWAADPGLHRNLPTRGGADHDLERRFAERLAAADALRPGCSIREAEDVIGALASFAVFDRLYKDGRRSPAAVGEVLLRLAAGILA